MQSQKCQNGLCSFLRQSIQYHSNPSLIPDQWCWRSWSWTVLSRPSRTNKRCHFHHKGLECKSRNSRDNWSNRNVWPWSTKLTRAKANRVLPRNALVIANTLLQQHKKRLYTWTSPDGQYQSQTDYILCSQRWRSSIQSAKTRPGADVAQIMNSLLPNSDLNWRK